MSTKIKVFVLGIRGFPDVQGGIEKHCEKIYSLLATLDCEIVVFTRKSYIRNYISEWKGIKYIHLWAPRYKHLEAIVHTFLGIFLSKLYSPEILHIHAIGPAILTPLAKLLGLRVVVTNHGPDYHRKKWGKVAKFFLKLGEIFSIKFADKVIVVSKSYKTFLEKKYRRKDLTFIPNGVNISQIIPNKETLEKYQLQPKKYIFTACRFVPEKGLLDLIHAYRTIKDPELKLVISGDADHETQYSKKIKVMAQNTNGVILTGILTGKPLQELYSNAGLFVLASYYEGLPITLLEALSYGLPVLVSDIPAHKELPLPEFRYFEPGNIKMLAKKMIELLKIGITEDEKEKIREVLLKDYNWDKIALKTFEVYKSVVSKEKL